MALPKQTQLPVIMVTKLLVLYLILIHVATDNLLCLNESWNVIEGNWTYDPSVCKLTALNTNNSENIVWFGSADGQIYNAEYDNDSFIIKSVFEIKSGETAGLIFRAAKEVAAEERSNYYVGLQSKMDDGLVFVEQNDYSLQIDAATFNLTYNTIYELKVIASGPFYSVFINNSNASLIDVSFANESIEYIASWSFGSIGIRTYNASAIFHSLSYEVGKYFIGDNRSVHAPAKRYCESYGGALAFMPTK